MSTVAASYASVYDAGLVRLAELGRHLLALKADFQPVDEVAGSILDLRAGLEAVAQDADPARRSTTLAYLQETYGLLAVGTDPLLAPWLPVVPAQGAAFRPWVLAFGGKALSFLGKALSFGGRIVPASTTPTYNTTLLDSQTAGGFTYAGLAGSSVQVDTPVSLAVLNPGSFIVLSVGAVRIGKLDFPPSATGSGFSLTTGGTTYYGVLPDALTTGTTYAFPA